MNKCTARSLVAGTRFVRLCGARRIYKALRKNPYAQINAGALIYPCTLHRRASLCVLSNNHTIGA